MQIYAGFGDECKLEDLESLKTYKVRLTVEIDGNSSVSRSTEWLTVTTNKEPFSIALLNSAVKRDDGIKVRTILTTEKVTKVINETNGFLKIWTAFMCLFIKKRKSLEVKFKPEIIKSLKLSTCSNRTKKKNVDRDRKVDF